ncbi:MAG TPA: hypothetical protein VNT00_03840 [Eoetvoesiella sp.]|jgi:hypothetical protein|nr:hypothetical protein [Eoetvoesiella sp.]HWK60532.1 hypothetical protein [Eoetvoesiella sp.]
MSLSKKPTQKKTPFVVEPLNWVAPERRNKEAPRREAAEKEDDKDSSES